MAPVHTHPFDEITREELLAAGSVKWAVADRELPTAAGGAIGMFIAEMDFGIAEPILAALHDELAAPRFGYLPPSLIDGLGVATARWLDLHFGWSLEPDQIRPHADVLAACETAITMFSPPDKAVILPTPAYMPFLELPQTLGRRLITVPMDVAADGRTTIDLDGLDRAFADGGGLLILINPHNPTGVVYTPDELAAISDVVARHDGRVFADEIHAPLVYRHARHTPFASISAQAAAQAITATSASKAWNLAGLKCAELILTNDDDRRTWATAGYHREMATANLGVVATIAAFEHGDEWLAEVVDYLDGNRALLADLLAELLPGSEYRPPDGTFLTWVDCRQLGVGDDPGAFFAEHAGVLAIDGTRCGQAGFVRLNIATPRPLLVETIERMGRAVSRAGRVGSSALRR